MSSDCYCSKSHNNNFTVLQYHLQIQVVWIINIKKKKKEEEPCWDPKEPCLVVKLKSILFTTYEVMSAFLCIQRKPVVYEHNPEWLTRITRKTHIWAFCSLKHQYVGRKHLFECPRDHTENNVYKIFAYFSSTTYSYLKSIYDILPENIFHWIQ